MSKTFAQLSDQLGVPSDNFEELYLVSKVGSFSATLSDFEGKVLTLLDASICDKQQNKALKDLFRQELWQMYRDFWCVTANEKELVKHEILEQTPDEPTASRG